MEVKAAAVRSIEDYRKQLSLQLTTLRIIRASEKLFVSCSME